MTRSSQSAPCRPLCQGCALRCAALRFVLACCASLVRVESAHSVLSRSDSAGADVQIYPTENWMTTNSVTESSAGLCGCATREQRRAAADTLLALDSLWESRSPRCAGSASCNGCGSGAVRRRRRAA